MSVVVVDYGMGNLGSLRNLLQKIGADFQVSADPLKILSASRLILPGVGAWDSGMAQVESLGLRQPLNQAVLENKVPVLGICLGMQLMFTQGQEGKLPGLNWLKGQVVHFPPELSLSVPHMGWNQVEVKKEVPLFTGLRDEVRFYFVHSYYASCDDGADVAAITHHYNSSGSTSARGVSFTSAVQCGNIFGVQFHPEKSHRYGIQLFKNFLGMS